MPYPMRVGDVDHRRMAVVIVPFLLAACTAAQATTRPWTAAASDPVPVPVRQVFIRSVRSFDEQLRNNCVGRNWRPGCSHPPDAAISVSVTVELLDASAAR